MGLKNLLVSLACLLFCAGCYQKVEGCLDITASNFDVSADTDCCCDYPTFSAQLTHHWDTANFIIPDTYPISGGEIHILDFRFYLSDFQFIKQQDSFSVRDELEVQYLLGTGDTASQVIQDDILLISPLTQNESIGTFRDPGNYEGFILRFGLSSAAAKTLPSSTPSDHPLSFRSDSMYNPGSMEYIACQMTYQIIEGGLGGDTVRSEVPVNLSFPFGYVGGFTVPNGRNFIIPISIDYKTWLQGIDINSSPGDISILLASGVDQAFRIE